MLFTSMHLFRYLAEFVSVNGHSIRAEIWQDGSKFPHASSMTPATLTENTAPAGQPQNGYIRVNVAADSPLVIETSELSKEEPIHGSSASLILISEANFQFLDMYTTDYLSTDLRVYVDDTLYWTGHLDTEQYSEPFELKNNYQVKLTFNDFGVLKRVKLGKNDKVSLCHLLLNSFKRIGYSLLLEEIRSQCHSSTTIHSTARDPRYEANHPNDDIFTSLYVDTSNLGDATCYDLLEAALKPLGLHLIQNAGKFTVYDLNYLATHDVELDDIPWAGDTQDLSVDKVYNNIEVNTSSNIGETTSAEIFPNESFPKESSQFDIQRKNHLPYFDASYYPDGDTSVTQLNSVLKWHSGYSGEDYVIRSRPFRNNADNHFYLKAHSRQNVRVQNPDGTYIPSDNRNYPYNPSVDPFDDHTNNNIPEPGNSTETFAYICETPGTTSAYENELKTSITLYPSRHPGSPSYPNPGIHVFTTPVRRGEYYYADTSHTVFSLAASRLASNPTLMADSPFSSVTTGNYCRLTPLLGDVKEQDVISLSFHPYVRSNSIEPILATGALTNDLSGVDTPMNVGSDIATLNPIRVSAGNEGSFIGINVPILLSGRPNPFDSFDKDIIKMYGQGGSYESIKATFDNQLRFLYLAVRIEFVDDETGITYYYDNSNIVKRSFTQPITNFDGTIGVWTPVESVSYIAYYEPSLTDGKRVSGLDNGKGFTSNRQAINPSFDQLNTDLVDIDDGQFIPYPKRVDTTYGDRYMSGTISITFINTFRAGIYDWKHNQFYDLESDESLYKVNSFLNFFTTAFIGVPVVSFYSRSNRGFNHAESSDVSYSTFVDSNISEGLSVDCRYSSYTKEFAGSLSNYSTYNLGDVDSFTRHGSSDEEVEANPGPAELLLCGTLYSQYHDRHIVLSGDTFINDSTHTGDTDFVKSMMFTSPHPEMAGKKFMLSSSSVDLQADTQSSTLVETTEDVYVPQQL